MQLRVGGAYGYIPGPRSSADVAGYGYIPHQVLVINDTSTAYLTVSLSDPKTVVHSSKGRLMVTRMEPRS